MFEKLVCIESAGRMTPQALGGLGEFAREVVLYEDIPSSPQEVLARMAGADAVLVSYTSRIEGDMLRACPGLKYVGMCCSLYGPESANVDILAARELGVTVTGVHAYGDRGVPEFVVSELVALLHGFRGLQWREEPLELTGQRFGLLGLGATGALIARALRFFGAQVRYYSRTPKPELEAELGLSYSPLEALLPWCDMVCSCLNTHIVAMDRRAFELLGDGKIYINTAIAPGHDLAALEAWLARPGNFAIGDLVGSIDPGKRLQALPNVISPMKSSGMTAQARVRLGEKVLENLARYLESGVPAPEQPGIESL